MMITTEFALYALLIGIGATLLMDLWSVLAARFLAFQPPNYALVGRWLGHMPQGRFVHAAIAKSAPIPGERIIGWIAHYVIGIAFAGLLLAVYGTAWTESPTLLPALTVGLLTLAAPFLLMQPGMGAGVAASRTPKPYQARLRSILTHIVFGFGLYGAAVASKAML